MVTFDEISFDELSDLVRLGFCDDERLMKEFQQLPTELDVTVKRNLDNIETSASFGDLRYFRVGKDEIPIGFTVIDVENYLLISFGINIRYRQKESVIEWFGKVKEMFPDGFCCVLWNQNQRAINFLEKQGMQVYNKNSEITALIFK